MSQRPKPSPIKLSDLTTRPGLGQLGRAVRVRTNFFEVLRLPDTNAYQYDFDIIPEVPPALNRKIFKHFEDTESEGILGGIKPVYDGRKNVYSIKQFPFGEAITFQITLPEGETNQSAKRPPRQYTIKLKKVAEKNLEEVIRFVNGKSAASNNVLTAINALDVLINQVPATDFTAFCRRAFFTSEGSRRLYGGAEVWQGYWQSLRPGQGKFYINFDTSATAFHEPGNVATVIARILGFQRAEDLRHPLNDKDRLKVEKTLKQLRFHVTHRGDNFRRRYKIKKLSESSARETRFSKDIKEEGEDQIYIEEYFQQKYNLQLRYPFLPCIVSQSGYFPVEVCYLEKGQRIMRKLTDKQTAEMIKFTCQPPAIRSDKIQKGMISLNYDQNEYCRQWGLEVASNMAVVDARILPSPELASGNESRFFPQQGVWQLGPGKKMLNGATLISWSVVVFAGPQQIKKEAVELFVRELTKTLTENGMNIVNPKPPILHENPQGNIENSIRKAYQTAGNAAKKSPQLILCILQGRSSLYDEIKRIEDTILGIPTQCAMSNKILRANKQYYGMLGLKINVKLQGNNMSLQHELPFLKEAPTIIFGADVTHPSLGDESPSIAALVGSFDSKATKYATSIKFQASRTEIISDLKEMVQELLRVFYKETRRKPGRILFYRDGVSEGQFEVVLNDEVDAIRKACTELEETYKPTITFVVVQKRHHARFFPMDNKDSDRSKNCLPGTIVEKTITHPFEFDFYLQSHPGLQGTSRPTHYHVLIDENKFNADSLQTLTYNLCYLYARCPRAVSVVPPAYYAHLAAFRARCWRKSSTFSEGSSESGKLEDYGSLKPELQKIMFFI